MFPWGKLCILSLSLTYYNGHFMENWFFSEAMNNQQCIFRKSVGSRQTNETTCLFQKCIQGAAFAFKASCSVSNHPVQPSEPCVYCGLRPGLDSQNLYLLTRWAKYIHT